MADRECPGAFLGDRLDVRAGANPADRDRLDAFVTRARENLRRVALSPAVAEEDESLLGCRCWTPERAVGRGYGHCVGTREAEEIGALVRSVETRAGANDVDPPGADSFSRLFDHMAVSDKPRKLVGLPAHRHLHLSQWRDDQISLLARRRDNVNDETGGRPIRMSVAAR
jgi:hypothetical protein